MLAAVVVIVFMELLVCDESFTSMLAPESLAVGVMLTESSEESSTVYERVEALKTGFRVPAETTRLERSALFACPLALINVANNKNTKKAFLRLGFDKIHIFRLILL